MWKYVWLLGGLCGLLVSLLVTCEFGDNVEGLNLIIFKASNNPSTQGDEIYRYNLEHNNLRYLRQRPAENKFNNLLSTWSSVSPSGFWISTTYFAHPTWAYIVDSISGTLVRIIEFKSMYSIVDVIWSPDSKYIAYAISHPGNTQFLIVDVLKFQAEQISVPTAYTHRYWQDNRTLEIDSDTGIGTYLIDIKTGQVTYDENGFIEDRGTIDTSDVLFTLKSARDALDIQVSADEQKIAYVRAVSDDEVGIFLDDRQSSETRQITTSPLDVGKSYVNGNVYWPILGTWSLNGDWITLRINNDLWILNVHTGQIRQIMDRRGAGLWTEINLPDLPDNRNFALLWVLSSGVVFLLGVWRMVA